MHVNHDDFFLDSPFDRENTTNKELERLINAYLTMDVSEQIILFYLIYYSLLAAFWVACLQIFFLTLPEGKPRYCSCQDPGY
jgi:hypothetical protein